VSISLLKEATKDVRGLQKQAKVKAFRARGKAAFAWDHMIVSSAHPRRIQTLPLSQHQTWTTLHICLIKAIAINNSILVTYA